MTGPVHKPGTWASGFTYMGLKMQVQDAKATLAEMKRQCADNNTPLLQSSFGECTADRLFDYSLPEFMKNNHRCSKTKRALAKSLADKLQNSQVLKSFDARITEEALMGCETIGEGCSKVSWKDSILQTVVDNLDNEFLGVGSAARNEMVKYAKTELMNQAGVDEETADLLLDWALYHKKGTNKYCDHLRMLKDRDMLVKGLTAADPDHVKPPAPWEYTEKQVYKPFRELLRDTIEGMFQADCDKEQPQEVSLEDAKNGVGLNLKLSEERKQELQSTIQEAVAENDFIGAHKAHSELSMKNVIEPLLPFADIQLINTTLEYMMSPTLQHPIEAIDADVVRICLRTLGNLLSDKEFLGHLRRNDKNGKKWDWSMPPELDTLWKKTREAKHGERIWGPELVNKFRQPGETDADCKCTAIEKNLGVHMLNQLQDIGLDFGHVTMDRDGKLSSTKATETLQHVNLEAFTRTMVAVEAGIQDPQYATKYIIKKMMKGAQGTGSDSAVPDVKASGKVKGVLVGMPIVQNLWAALEKNNGFSTEVFAKKMKWFFVANIVWAVWHAIESNLPPEDIVLGLLTAAMSSLSSFAYDGKWITFSNSAPFTDYMLAVYTVWNYRFVKQWASTTEKLDEDGNIVKHMAADGKEHAVMVESPQNQWMHVSVALSMPIIEALANHGDVTYYINYRRDDLFAAMLLMLDNQIEENLAQGGRCCCDFDTDPSMLNRLASQMSLSMKSGTDTLDEIRSDQKCTLVPDNLLTKRGTCPVVRKSAWHLQRADAAYEWQDADYIMLHHDANACADVSKIIKVPAASFR
eukprot:TRINITY_DN29446_c0_g1_i1.p1 TRINITY_DN29446_c0_g1~~TRINITY_DN29446_c0_g1_i1.p1  ORF type:complete len:945 (-),score=286.35 TRINITY_DN29446_c0_g1_i1:118-2538(-)